LPLPALGDHSRRRLDIDGLRALAVGAVLVFHAFPYRLPGGHAGVDVFFVISGFVITRTHIATVENGTFSWVGFYRQRVRRIFPALIIVLLACAIGGWVLLWPVELVRLGTNILAAALFVPNLLLWSEVGYFDMSSQTKPLLHLWSLGIEEQFYLLWPVMMLLLGRTKWLVFALLALSVASFAYSFYTVDTNPTAAFYSPLSRMWELGTGCILAIWLHRQAQAPVFSPPWCNAMSMSGIAMVVIAFVKLNSNSPFPGWRAMLPVLGTALVIAGKEGWVNRAILSNRSVVYIGLISYPLYLWHWPLLTFSRIEHGDLSIVTRVSLLSLAFVLAATTYAFVERPISRIRNIRVVSGTALASMTFAGLAGLFFYGINGAPFRFPAQIQPIIAYENYDGLQDARPACWIANDVDFSTIANECYPSPDPIKQSVLIWGDSHAARLYPGVRAVLDSGIDVAQFARNSCPPVLDIPDILGDDCARGNKAILDQLRRSPPAVVVLFGAWERYGNYGYDWSPDSYFGGKLALTIDQLKREGVAKIILVGPAPRFDPSLPRLVFNQWASGNSVGTLPDRLIEGVSTKTPKIDADLSMIARGQEVQYASIFNFLCDDKGCVTHGGASRTDLITWDDGHLTTSGATIVAKDMVDAGLFSIKASLPEVRE